MGLQEKNRIIFKSTRNYSYESFILTEYSVYMTCSRYNSVILVIQFKYACSFCTEILCYDNSRDKN
jgi:hypothetical protein